MIKSPFILAVCLCLVAGQSSAHLLKVFAYGQSDQISGKVYFAGGAVLKNLAVTVTNLDNLEVLQTRTDDHGKFLIRVPRAATYKVSADSNDGHTASWTIQGTQLAPQISPAADEKTRPQSTITDAQELRIERMVSQAVARQIEPLTERIIAQQEKAKFQDIIGALGYIAGIFGAVMWWRQRQTKGKT